MKKLLIAVSLILSACTNPSSDNANPVEELPINKVVSPGPSAENEVTRA